MRFRAVVRRVIMGPRLSRGRQHNLMLLGCGADPIAKPFHALLLGAVLAAEEGALLLEPMPDDADAAMGAGRRQRVDRALEAVESVSDAVLGDLKRLVVIVAAGFTSLHDTPPHSLVELCGYRQRWARSSGAARGPSGAPQNEDRSVSFPTRL